MGTWAFPGRGPISLPPLQPIPGVGSSCTCRGDWKHLFLRVWGGVEIGDTCGREPVGGWGPGAVGQSPGPRPVGRPQTARTYGGQRLRASGSGRLGAVRAAGAEAFLGRGGGVEGLGVLHREAGAGRAGRQAGEQAAVRRVGSGSRRVLFAPLLRAAGSRLRPTPWSGFRIQGVGWGGGGRQGNQGRRPKGGPGLWPAICQRQGPLLQGARPDSHPAG